MGLLSTYEQKQHNLPELLPKGMNYEGIYGGPYIYSHVYSQFMADTTKSRKATLKPLKSPCFIAAQQYCSYRRSTNGSQRSGEHGRPHSSDSSATGSSASVEERV